MHPRITVGSAAGTLWLIALVAVAGAAPDSARKSFDVPAGAAEAALREFSKQAGVQMIFDSEKVSKVRTARVRGEYEPREALNRMFAGTGLSALQDHRSGALTLQSANGPNARRAAPLPTGDRPMTQTSLAAAISLPIV